MIKIAHTADWHIGRFAGPEKDGVNARFANLCQKLQEFTEQMEEEKPDVIIVAGDVFHQARTWSDRGLDEVQTVIEFLRKLEKIATIIVLRGTPNHDGEYHFQLLETAFAEDEKVKVVSVPKVITVHTDHGTVEVACLPGFERGYFRANNPGLSKEQEDKAFTDSVKSIVLGLKAQCKGNCPTILTGHYTIAGSDLSGGQTMFFSKFEPVVTAETLKSADFDLVCFGHLHTPQQITGADNVYYSGALSQLNFNDEGLKRGYYIHEIEDGKVESIFHPLPGLRFHTIHLDDEEVARIIEKGVEITDDLKDEIIRVLYNCTDEHHKAFNHADLQRALMKAGAFWVQEIVPEKITITADKRSLSTDSTPEDNLIGYLKEKEIPESTISRILEVARPIIYQATESYSNEKESGIFLPIEIEVENYRNYKHEIFNYDDIRFCTINGENGTGKSSLFMDAILDVLFEEPREGEVSGWISNDPDAKSGSIKFTFQLGEKIFRVTRTRSKKGKATLSLAEWSEGQWQDRGKEKFRDTQQSISNLLGIDSLTLKACALIMQDQYGLFLQADKESRMAILGKMLGLGLYDEMEKLASEKAKESNRQIKMLNNEREVQLGLCPDTDGLLSFKDIVEGSQLLRKKELDEQSSIYDQAQKTISIARQAHLDMIELNDQINENYEERILLDNSQLRTKALLMEAEGKIAAESDVKERLKNKEKLEQEEKELLKLQGEYTASDQRLFTELRRLDEKKADLEADYRKWGKFIENSIMPKEEQIRKIQAKEAEYNEAQQIRSQLAILDENYDEWQSVQNELAQLEKEYLEREHQAKEELTGLKVQFESLEKQAKLLDELDCPYVKNGEAGCALSKEALEAKNKLPKLNEKIALANAQTELRQSVFQSESKRLMSRITELCELGDFTKMRALRLRLEELSEVERDFARLDDLRKELNNCKVQTKEMKESYEQKSQKIKEMEAEVSSIQDRNEKMKRELDRLIVVQQDLEALKAFVEFEKKLPIYKERKITCEKKLADIKEEIELINQKNAKLLKEEKEKEALYEQQAEAEAKAKAAESQIEKLKEKISEGDKQLGSIELQLEQAREIEDKIAVIDQKIKLQSQKAADYDILKKAFSQNGIPHNIIRSVIPILENSATNILGQMSGGAMSVEFVMDKVLKSNNKKEVNTLDIVINDAETGSLPYNSRSGGEKVKAALSVILALSEVKQKQAGIQFGFLMIDEAPFLDANATQAYCDALEAIQRRYGDVKVMAITHDESFKARFPQSVTVYKDRGGSHVRVD